MTPNEIRNLPVPHEGVEKLPPELEAEHYTAVILRELAAQVAELGNSVWQIDLTRTPGV